MEKMLTTQDVAERLGRTPYTVRRWIAKGLLKSSHLGGRHLISEADLTEFMERQERSMYV